jgi:Fe-S-cluster containining protein
MLSGETRIKFRCHKDVKCFNACCKNIDITLTPYDIVRLRSRLKISSSEFLRDYTVPYEMEKDGIGGVKMLPVEGGTACQFMTDEGCSVYEDRPTSCRYYPVALLSMRQQDEYVDRTAYAWVQEEHCLGHQEDRELTIDEYRAEQGVTDYDDIDRGWRQLVLKKKSSGPTIGKPSMRSRQLFFMVCYDIDRFRAFVATDEFQDGFEFTPEEWLKILDDDVELLQFGFRLLRQVLFGEESLPVRNESREQRQARIQARQAQKEEEARLAREKMADDPYNEPDEVVEKSCKDGCGEN